MKIAHGIKSHVITNLPYELKNWYKTYASDKGEEYCIGVIENKIKEIREIYAKNYELSPSETVDVYPDTLGLANEVLQILQERYRNKKERKLSKICQKPH
ncbi:hypothetical protein [Candidatus Liberibacter sp.]|uniref:hypothetical protein n=1 Tax=Candidatus Liberibacter sp. TaxID=34022 RepID=UPI0015F6B9BC|nr:hypothetical protein [Candidatus Liberibacter sp.]MBA5724497.1 hypothetical protein [Candidatus Liberibacter sp.]